MHAAASSDEVSELVGCRSDRAMCIAVSSEVAKTAAAWRVDEQHRQTTGVLGTTPR